LHNKEEKNICEQLSIDFRENYIFRLIALRKFNTINLFCGHKAVSRSKFIFFSFSCFCNSFQNCILVIGTIFDVLAFSYSTFCHSILQCYLECIFFLLLLLFVLVDLLRIFCMFRRVAFQAFACLTASLNK